MQAVVKLGYERHAVAGSLRSARTTMIALSIPDITEMAPKQAAVVHLIECARDPSTHIDISSLKLSSSTRIDDVATALGDAVLRRE